MSKLIAELSFIANIWLVLFGVLPWPSPMIWLLVIVWLVMTRVPHRVSSKNTRTAAD